MVLATYVMPVYMSLLSAVVGMEREITKRGSILNTTALYFLHILYFTLSIVRIISFLFTFLTQVHCSMIHLRFSSGCIHVGSNMTTLLRFSAVVVLLSLLLVLRIFPSIKLKKGKLGSNAMKRVAAGAHLSTPWLFEPAKMPRRESRLLPGHQTIEPTTAWTAVSFPSASIARFYT